MFSKVEKISSDIIWTMLTVAAALALFFAVSWLLQKYSPSFLRKPVAVATSYVNGDAYNFASSATPVVVPSNSGTNSGIPQGFHVPQY
jgi:hypothetical protein